MYGLMRGIAWQVFKDTGSFPIGNTKSPYVCLCTTCTVFRRRVAAVPFQMLAYGTPQFLGRWWVSAAHAHRYIGYDVVNVPIPPGGVLQPTDYPAPPWAMSPRGIQGSG